MAAVATVAVKVENDKVFLELDSGQRLSMDNVISVQNASGSAPAGQ